MSAILLYLSEIPELVNIEKVVPPEREKEIDECSNEKIKREKYCVWKLLELALRNSTGTKPDFTALKRGGNGKWYGGDKEFSLSHSNGVVAVALSDKPVGVDVQFVKEISQNTVSKILSKQELEVLESLSKQERTTRIIETWARKESDFKRVGGDNFLSYIRYNCTVSGFTDRITLSKGDYVVAVSGDGEVELKIVKL